MNSTLAKGMGAIRRNIPGVFQDQFHVGQLAFQREDLVNALAGRELMDRTGLGLLRQNSLLSAVAGESVRAGEVVFEGQPTRATASQGQSARQPVPVVAELPQCAAWFGHVSHWQTILAQQLGQQKRIVTVGFGAPAGRGAHTRGIGQVQLTNYGFDAVPEPVIKADRFDGDLHVKAVTGEVSGDLVAVLGGDVFAFKHHTRCIKHCGGERGFVEVHSNSFQGSAIHSCSRKRTAWLQRKSNIGFTLIELLVVVGIIAALAGLVLAGLSRVESKAHRTACLSNLKQFCVALQLYAGDHADYLLPNLDGEKIPLGKTWVEGWLGLPGPDCTNTAYLQRSLVGVYLGASKVWQCPSVEPVTLGNFTQPRVRTVSLNCFMGSPIKSPAATTYLKLGDIMQPSPALALTFLEERVETINDASFAIQWDFEEKDPLEWLLRDKPEALHDNGGNLGFADGHVESHRWLDARTLDPPRDDANSPNNRDVLWLEQRGTWRGR